MKYKTEEDKMTDHDLKVCPCGGDIQRGDSYLDGDTGEHIEVWHCLTCKISLSTANLKKVKPKN